MAEAAYLKFSDASPDASTALWEALHLVARQYGQGFRQRAMRDAGREDDLVNDLTLHLLEKVQARALQEDRAGERTPLSHWLNVTCKNFCTDARQELTHDQRRFSSIAKGEPAEDADEWSEPADEISENQFPQDGKSQTERGTTRLSARVDDGIEALKSESDQAYARFLSLGLTQKEAAERMGESVVTSRKREARIRESLGQAGFGATAEASSDNVVCIQACADEDGENFRFEPLLGVPEAAQLLGVHEKTVQAMARAGKLPCVRMGKYWRFRASSLDAWVKAGLESNHDQSRRVA